LQRVLSSLERTLVEVLILRGLSESLVYIRVIIEIRRLVREMGTKERLNVETSEGLNVEKEKRAEPCRKKEGGGDGLRPFPAGPGPSPGNWKWAAGV